MEKNKLLAMGQAAKSASYALAACDTATKNDLLRSIATALRQAEGPICAANEHDVQEAKEGGMGSAMLDRLLLTPQRLDALAADVEAVCSLPDPVGRVPEQGRRRARQPAHHFTFGGGRQSPR